jgi:uncharacterized repeat protein (TIGR03803 family)
MKYQCPILSLLVSGALLTACGGVQTGPAPTVMVPSATLPLSTSGVEKVLYSFLGGADGEYPASPLVDVKGELYGTTREGGSKNCPLLGFRQGGVPGCGTIFKLATSGSSWVHSVVYQYPGSARTGADPNAGVIYSRGKLYGTTAWGGEKGSSYTPCKKNQGCGTLYEMDPSSNKYFVLNRFDGTDGYAVTAGVLDNRGTLYGAATGSPSEGSQCPIGCGLVYTFKPNGEETTLHTFDGSDGNLPYYAPIVFHNTVYGATIYGGGGTACNAASGPGCGVIYAMSTKGTGYRVLYSFKGGADGGYPTNVIEVRGTLYGTTDIGGDLSCASPSGPGCGTIFSISTHGKGFRVLHRFVGGNDGVSPNSLLADMNGTLYSDTSFGGGTSCSAFGGSGCGTVFKVQPSGKGYEVIYRFQGGTDGGVPAASGVVDINGSLYGATELGGGSGCGGAGCGTVFQVTP